MVKKTKLLDRLLSKWRSAPAPKETPKDALKPDALKPNGGKPLPGKASLAQPTGASPAGAKPAAAVAASAQPVNRLASEPPRARVSVDPEEDFDGNDPQAASPVKVTSKKDAVAAVTEGLSELGNLLRGINSRMDSQNARSDQLLAKFDDLPATAKAQIEFLQAISRQLAESRNRTEALAERFADLPDLMRGIHQTLKRQVDTEVRTEGSLTEFRNTMDRINTSITNLTAGHAQALKDNQASFERTHNHSVRVFEQTQKETVQSFKQVQDNQVRLLSQVMEKNQGLNKAILVFLVLTLGALVALIAAVA